MQILKRKSIKTFLLFLLSISMFLFSSCTVDEIDNNDELGKIEDLEIIDGKGPDEELDKSPEEPFIEQGSSLAISKDGHYTSKEEVAFYLDLYEELPGNFISKKDAMDLGWNSKKGNLWDVADGMSIGGDKFGNREGILPNQKGRQYYECDINYQGGFRGGERIVYSNDGLIYYTNDHYKSFKLIYGDE